MSEMDDKMTVFGEWPPLNPSPRTFMSNFLNEEFGSKSFSDLLVENENKMPLLESEKQKVCMNSIEECVEDDFGFSSNISLEPNFFDGRKSSSRVGLAQRIARAGFNAPTINTACIKSANMDSSASEVRSPYLTIPPGLSPTTLLDSPVFLSNSMVQPSPTTGKFSFSSNVSHSLSISASDSSIQDKSKDGLPEEIASGGFSFKPHLNPTTSYFPNTENKISSAIDGQPLKGIEFSIQKEFNFSGCFSESIERKDSADDNTICPKPIDSVVSNECSRPLDQPNGEVETKGEISSISVATLEEDGYNWRKYGQKQVKGSEFPRSYYKCTHPNCQVKKKVERSLEGHITEIIYKGAHNHAKPLLKSRSGIPPSHLFNDTQANLDDLMDATLSNDVEAIDVSSSISKDEEEEDGVTHGSVAIGGDGEGDESESKRRKLDDCAVEMNTGSRAAREPRVVVQTTSEVDILDDGYRWRKYGQKVVKGNPNPRSYYKCTNPGCTVRKHVERASHDLKSVITTYEGKHNHDVPVTRNSSHSSSAPSTASTAQRRLELTQEVPMRFDVPPLLSTFNLPSFSFGIDQPGLANLGIGSLGQMGQVKMPPPLGPIHSNPPLLSSGFMVPKGEPKEEPMDAYHLLLMSRLPLGPQM